MAALPKEIQGTPAQGMNGSSEMCSPLAADRGMTVLSFHTSVSLIMLELVDIFSKSIANS